MRGCFVQTTLTSSVPFSGVGLHSGAPVRMTIHPGAVNTGIWFRRIDITGRDNMIPARWDVVDAKPLCTLLSNEAGVTVSTVEHVMAALAGCGVYNALIEIDGPEVPILDGSAVDFVSAIMARGLAEQDAPVRVIEVRKPIEVREGDAVARIEPAPELEIDFHIDFDEAAIGRQDKALNMANGSFVRELANCRTFCRQADVDWMQANGLALGGVPGENAVVFDGARVESGAGLRHADEPVRHKMLDALGDLALAGAPILGRYSGHRAGHAMTNRLLRALFADPEAWVLRECDAATAARLPGAHLSRADLAAAL